MQWEARVDWTMPKRATSPRELDAGLPLNTATRIPAARDAEVETISSATTVIT